MVRGGFPKASADIYYTFVIKNHLKRSSIDRKRVRRRRMSSGIWSRNGQNPPSCSTYSSTGSVLSWIITQLLWESGQSWGLQKYLQVQFWPVSPGEISSDLYRRQNGLPKSNWSVPLVVAVDLRWYIITIYSIDSCRSYSALKKKLGDFPIFFVTLSLSVF